MCCHFDETIFLPCGEVGDFAVVACDQFSSQPDYWEQIAREMPKYSALDYVLPECFLAQADTRIQQIKKAWDDTPKDRFYQVTGSVFVTRTTPYNRTRHGLVCSIDLDDYDYKPGNSALIRASERTIEQRIPPRVQIRRALSIELPHIMLLVDDPDNALYSACERAKGRTLYSGGLRGNGGSIKGELITDYGELNAAAAKIIEQAKAKLGTTLFALVGDGNHSLATAKYCAEHYPTPFSGRALVEIVNIYDDGLVCEPIHRLVKTADPAKFVKHFSRELGGDGSVKLCTASGEISASAPSDKVKAIQDIDRLCEEYVVRHGGSIEYVHGQSALFADGCVGIKLGGIAKSELFGYVVKNGVLPKKTFSLGEAEEKRYYIEGRRIK